MVLTIEFNGESRRRPHQGRMRLDLPEFMALDLVSFES